MNGNPYMMPPQGQIPPMNQPMMPPPPPRPRPPKKKKSRVNPGVIVAIVIASVMFVTLFVAVAGLGIYYLINLQSEKKTVQQVQNIIIDQGATDVVDDEIRNRYPDVYFPDDMLAKYAPVYAQNEDLSGWIELPMFNVSLPVMQSNDNSYYLDKDIYGNRSSYGTPFFDFRNSVDSLNRNTIVYGHNTRYDDQIFGMLENYRIIDGFRANPVISCNTLYEDYNWFVYAVYVTNSIPDHDNGYILPYNFTDIPENEFAQYLEEIDKRKLYTTGVDINTNDKILTLSTQCYDFDDARLVVVARLQREGESEYIDISKAVENPNPKYPQKWYDVNKKTNPYANDPRW